LLVIAAFAKGSARLVASAADVIAVARQAEPTEPLLADAARAGRPATRDAVRTFWTCARDDGLLPTGCDLTWLADTTSVLAHAETYLLMRETLPGTPKRYENWLATTWHRMAAAATARLAQGDDDRHDESTHAGHGDGAASKLGAGEQHEPLRADLDRRV
jgi:hypothetical protein